MNLRGPQAFILPTGLASGFTCRLEREQGLGEPRPHPHACSVSLFARYGRTVDQFNPRIPLSGNEPSRLLIRSVQIQELFIDELPVAIQLTTLVYPKDLRFSWQGAVDVLTHIPCAT